MKFSEENLNIPFPPTLNAKAVEKSLKDLTGEKATQLPVTLDLSECKFIEVVSLLMLISVLSKRKKQNLTTILRLPKSKKVRDYFRTWDFPGAVTATIEWPFFRLVHEDDQRYFGENRDVRDQEYAGAIIFDESSWQRLSSDRFFGFTVFKPEPKQTFKPKLALNVAADWKRVVIQTVLKKILDGPEEHLPSRIISEAFLNAIRHPTASKIVLVSHLSQHEEKRFFTLCLWDDGEGIVDTLRDALLNNPRISALDTIDPFNLKYHVRTPAEEKIITSSETPRQDASNEDLLYFSLLPGITSTLGEFPSSLAAKEDLDIQQSPDSAVRQNPSLNQPGMGLFLLTNAAIDMFGGSVSIRTSDLFLNMKRDPKKERADYSVKITSDNCELQGNLLTIRLPVKQSV